MHSNNSRFFIAIIQEETAPSSQSTTETQVPASAREFGKYPKPFTPYTSKNLSFVSKINVFFYDAEIGYRNLRKTSL